jgi:tetratricopeptide (TPR) repeat protein
MRTAIRLDPSDAFAYLNLGITLENLSLFDEALAEFGNGLAIPRERRGRT